MSNIDQNSTDNDIVWKGSTALLGILLTLALISWVGDRKGMTSSGLEEELQREKDRITEVSNDLDVANKALDDMGREHAAMKDRIGVMQSELKGAEKAESDHAKAMTLAKAESTRLNDLLAKTRSEKAEAEENWNAARADMTRLEEHRDSLLKEKETWAKRTVTAGPSETEKKLRAENTELKATAKRLKGEVDDKRELLEEKMRELQEALTAGATDDQSAELKKAIEKLKKDNARVTAQLAASKKKADKQDALLKEANAALDDAQSALQKQKAVRTASVQDGSGADAIGQNRILRAKLENTERELGRVNMDRGALAEEYKRSVEKQRALQKEIDALKKAAGK